MKSIAVVALVASLLDAKAFHIKANLTYGVEEAYGKIPEKFSLYHGAKGADDIAHTRTSMKVVDFRQKCHRLVPIGVEYEIEGLTTMRVRTEGKRLHFEECAGNLSGTECTITIDPPMAGMKSYFVQFIEKEQLPETSEKMVEAWLIRYNEYWGNTAGKTEWKVAKIRMPKSIIPKQVTMKVEIEHETCPTAAVGMAALDMPSIFTNGWYVEGVTRPKALKADYNVISNDCPNMKIVETEEDDPSLIYGARP